MLALDTIIMSMRSKLYDDVRKLIIEAVNHESESLVELNDMVTYINPSNLSIPLFNQPVVIEGKIYIDSRPFTKTTGEVRSVRDLKNHVTLGAMEHINQYSRDELFNSLGTLSATFAFWLSQAAMRRLNLNPYEQEVLKLGAFCYYWNMSQSEEKFERYREGEVVEVISRLVTTYLRMPNAIITDHAAAIETHFNKFDGTMDSLVSFLMSNINNPSLKVTPSSIVAMLIERAWFGFADKELSGIAIQNPAYLFFLIANAAESTAYSKTGIGEALNALKRTSKGYEGFPKQLTMFITEGRYLNGFKNLIEVI